MKKTHALFLAFIAPAYLSGCSFSRPYVEPTEKEPYALVKLKYKYSAVLDNTTLGARMLIRQDAKNDDDKYDSAFNQSYGQVRKGASNPAIPMSSVKVHPGKKTDMSVAVFYYWYTTQSYTTFMNGVPMVQTRQVYNESTCTAQVSFTPKAGAIYMIDYSNPNINRDCTANAYQQVAQKAGKFKLVKVASSK